MSDTTRTVFVAGATGVIGSRAVRQLVAAGHQVTGLARSPEKAALLRSWGAEAAPVDLFDPAALTTAVAGHGAVANLATHIPRTSKAAMPGAWKTNDRIRTEGSRNLVDAALAAGARTYIQESISFVYEDAGDRWIDEESAVRQVPYIQSAFDALDSTNRFSDGGGDGVFLRFAMFYAPDSHHDQDAFSFAKKGMSMEVGDLDAYKSQIHADDAAAAVVAALEVPTGIYNVGDDEPLTRGEHIDLMAELVGRKKLRRTLHKVRHVAGSKVELLARSQRISNQKFKAASGWSPAYPSVREGFPTVLAALDSHAVAS